MKGINTTKRLVGTALFAALAYAVSFWEFSIFPAAPFLKLDFSAVFICLAGFIFGPISGVVCCFIKELLAFMTKSSTGGIGEIANFIVIAGFIAIPSIVYCYKKGFYTVIVTLAMGCIVQVGLALLANRYVMFPLFFQEEALEWFEVLWGFIIGFNVVKSLAVFALTILLYKRISRIIKSI